MIEEYLSVELNQLDVLFKERFLEYGESWKQRSVEWLVTRLLVEVDELKSAADTGLCKGIRGEALDVALVALFLVERCNK